ncbi:unnamed protein product [Closterium sp. NIES-53]
MASRTLVSGLPRSLPPLPPGPAPTNVPCVEGRQHAAPHSSEFPPTEAPLQTLHMDVWGPARVRGQGHERYFLLVVVDYSRYTTLFPLRRKDRGVRCASDQPSVLCLLAEDHTYSAVDGEGWRCVCVPCLGILKHGTFAIADMLSSRAVPCVFLGFPPDAPGWQFFHPTLRCVLSSQDVTFDESVSYYRLFPYRTAPLPPPPLFLAPGAPPVDPLPPQGPAPSRVSQVDPVEPIEVAVNSSAPRGAEPAGARLGGAEPGVAESKDAEPRGAEPERVEPGGDEPEGAEPGGPESEGAELGGAEPERAESGGPSGVLSRREPLSSQRLREWYARRCSRAAGATGPGAGGASRAGAAGGAAGAGAAGATGPGGASAGGTGAVGGPTGVGAAGGTGAASPGGARIGGIGASGAGGAVGVGVVGAVAVATKGAAGAEADGGAGAGDAAGVVAGDPGAEGTGAVSAFSRGAARPRPYYVPLLQQPAYPLPGPSPYSGPTRGLTERREPESRPASPESRPKLPVCTVCTGRCVPHGPDPESDSLRATSPTVTRFLAPVVTDPSFESTAASALVAELVDFAAACRLDYTANLVAESVSASVCPPSVGDECALGTDVLEDRQEEFVCFAAAIMTPHSYAEAIEGPYSSQWQTPMDTEMASWKSTGTYVDEVPPPGANIVTGMWIFRGVDFFQTFSPTPKMTTVRVLLHVAAQRDYELHSLDFSTAFLQSSLHEEIWLRRPPSFTGSFPAGTQWSLRRPVYGLRQAPREWHDTLRMTLAALGFSPSTADLSQFLRTDTTLLPFYDLVYVDDLVFATAHTEALAYVKSELQKRHTCTDLGPLALRLHVLLATVHSSAYRSLALSSTFGRVPRYVAPGRHSKEHMDAAKRVLRYLCSTSGMGLVLGGRARVVLTGHADTSWVEDLTMQRSSQGYTFSLGSGSVSWQSTCSSSVLISSCEAEIYAGALSAQELRLLTYLLTDLGEVPRSPPVLYVDKKAMIALCQEHVLEHRTKHISLRYSLARELLQRGQLRLAYVATQANTADVFTKALQPCDHQRFCTVLGLVATVPHLLTS